MSFRYEWHDASYRAYMQGTYAENGPGSLIIDDFDGENDGFVTNSDPRTSGTVTETFLFAQEAADKTSFPDDAYDSDDTVGSMASSHAPTSSSYTTSCTSSRPHTPVNAPARLYVGQGESSYQEPSIPCEFKSVVGCEESFDARGEFGPWVNHHLVHLETDQPPPTRCTFCGTGEVFRDFWQRMEHIHQHWLNGEARRRIPDMNLLRYMRDNKIITKAAFESELDQLPPAPRHMLVALKSQEKEKGKEHDLPKEKRYRRKHTGGQSSSSGDGHHGRNGHRSHK